MALSAARQTVSDAYGDFTPAAATLLDWLNAARPILVSHFGYAWSTDWAAASFVNNSTAIPRPVEDRLAVAASIITYLTNNPRFEVPATGVTADVGSEIHARALETQQNVLNAERALKDAGTARDPLLAAFLKLMRTLIKNVSWAGEKGSELIINSSPPCYLPDFLALFSFLPWRAVAAR